MNMFDTGDFMLRGRCGTWSEFWTWYYISANIGIWAAYMLIPLNLWLQSRKTKLQKHSWTLNFGFIVFIFLCGFGHLIENVGAFWWPNYHFFAHWHMATAVVSIGVAIKLPDLLLQRARGGL